VEQLTVINDETLDKITIHIKQHSTYSRFGHEWPAASVYLHTEAPGSLRAPNLVGSVAPRRPLTGFRGGPTMPLCRSDTEPTKIYSI
jgi:hypothetical protein